MDKILLIQIFASVIIGIVSAAYFYQSTNIFMEALRKPLKLIGCGMMVISAGVLLAAFITYESSLGLEFSWQGYPLSVFFYLLYLVGSLLIILGARKFASKPKPVSSAV